MNEVGSVTERVIKIVSDLFKIPHDKITYETKFTDDLHAKSIDIIALLAALGGEFKMTISSQEVQSNQTVGQAIAYIENKLKS